LIISLVTALYVVADGVHQVGFAHTDAAVEEERVVGLGGALGDSLGGGHGELVAAADDEGVELIFGVELGGGAPVEAGLLGGTGGAGGCGAAAVAGGCGRVLAVAGDGSESTVLADLAGAGGVGILGGGLEDDVLDLEAEVLDGLLDEVGVAVADVLELCRGDAHKERVAGDMREARGLEPRVVGLAIDLLFERRQDANPIIQYGGSRGSE
jgi:hypothetical protein